MPSRSNAPSSVALILVELGSEWPEWLHEKVKTSTRRVLCQMEGESPGKFAERALATLESEKLPALSAILLCNERQDPEQSAARARLARALGDTLSSSHTLQVRSAIRKQADQAAPL